MKDFELAKIHAPLCLLYHRARSGSFRVVIKLATFNVNGVNGRLPRLLEWLAEMAPDIVCLQELKTDDTKFPAKKLESAGYGAIWHGQRAHHGVAILARGKVPTEVRRGLPPRGTVDPTTGHRVPGNDDDKATRYIEADVDGLRVASVYLPNGNPVPSPNFDYKLAWFERFIRHADELGRLEQPIVLAGDLNVVPTDKDIYNAYWWRTDAVMQPEARDAYRRLIAQGWIDAARHLHPDERIYTYWTSTDAFNRGKGMKLDFILVNDALKTRLRAFGVDGEHRGREKPSDHAPVWVSID